MPVLRFCIQFIRIWIPDLKVAEYGSISDLYWFPINLVF